MIETRTRPLLMPALLLCAVSCQEAQHTELKMHQAIYGFQHAQAAEVAPFLNEVLIPTGGSLQGEWRVVFDYTENLAIVTGQPAIVDYILQRLESVYTPIIRQQKSDMSQEGKALK